MKRIYCENADKGYFDLPDDIYEQSSSTFWQCIHCGRAAHQHTVRDISPSSAQTMPLPTHTGSAGKIVFFAAFDGNADDLDDEEEHADIDKVNESLKRDAKRWNLSYREQTSEQLHNKTVRAGTTWWVNND